MKTNTALAIVFNLTLVGVTPLPGATTEYFDHSLFQSAAGPLTLINFDSLSPGNGVLTGTEFLPQGLSIIQRDSVPMNVVGVGVGFAFTENANSLPNVISSSVGVGGTFSDVTDNYDFIFSQPGTAAGLWIGNVDPGSTEVQFLDALGNILANETFVSGHVGIIGSPGGANRIFYGLVSDTPVARIRTVEGTGESDGVTYDDIVYSVPEPSVPALLGACSILAVLSRRDRNHRNG